MSDWIKCPNCEGTTREWADDDECETCNDNGWVDDPDGGTKECPNCNGDSARNTCRNDDCTDGWVLTDTEATE